MRKQSTPKLTIAGITYRVSDLAIGTTKTFDGVGLLKKSTITRTSKNWYKVTIRTEYQTFNVTKGALKDAVDWLQERYDSSGSLLELCKPFVLAT